MRIFNIRLTRDARLAMVVSALLALAPARAGAQSSDSIYLYNSVTTAARRDWNGFLLNPAWTGADGRTFRPRSDCDFRAATGELGQRTINVRNAKCLSSIERQMVTLNEALGELGLGFECQSNSQIGELRGHVNWFPVTASGRLSWVHYGHGFFDDGDLTLNLFTPYPNATTVENEHQHNTTAYHVEFNRRETIDWASPTSQSLWSAIRHQLGDDRALRALLNNRFAIITGTFNLDGVHLLHAELHPAFMMAVLVDTVRIDEHHVRERWAIMSRNLGNQGDCSDGSLALLTSPQTADSQRVILDLGWWTGASATATMAIEYRNENAPKPRFTTNGDQCTCILFNEPRPTTIDDRYLLFGTVELTWTHEKAGSSLDRFPSDGQVRWDPRDFGGIRVDAIPSSVFQRAIEGAPLPPKGTAGEKTLKTAAERETARSLSELGKQTREPYVFEALDAGPARLTTPTTTRTYRSVPLLDSRPTETTQCARQLFRDPLCLGGTRLIVSGGLNATTVSGSWDVAWYAYPHAFPSVGDILGTLGYRIDLRQDAFHPRHEGPTNIPQGRPFSIEGSVVYQPNSRRLSDHLTVSPYAFVGPGIMTSRDRFGYFGLQRGLGVELRIGMVDFTPEYHHNYYWGNVAESTVWSIGMYVRRPW